MLLHFGARLTTLQWPLVFLSRSFSFFVFIFVGLVDQLATVSDSRQLGHPLSTKPWYEWSRACPGNLSVEFSNLGPTLQLYCYDDAAYYAETFSQKPEKCFS